MPGESIVCCYTKTSSFFVLFGTFMPNFFKQFLAKSYVTVKLPLYISGSWPRSRSKQVRKFSPNLLSFYFSSFDLNFYGFSLGFSVELLRVGIKELAVGDTQL